jgi:DUF1009 family protein
MLSLAMPSSFPQPKLGIIAGSTELPRVLIEACQTQGRDFFVLALDEACEDATIDGIEHEWMRLGALGKALSALKREGVEELVLAGKVKRPRLANLRPDLKATKLLARLGSNLLKGDDELLRTIITFLEDEGFRVVGVQDVAPELVTPEGLIGSIYPDKKAQADISFGAKIARGVGALDIGQSVIVQNHQVLGVEAIEGTDRLIERCTALKVEERGGVLVKVKKPHQEGRVDLPTIGVETVERVAAAGFSGIAIEAGSSLMLDRKALARRADALDIFVVGFSVVD